MAEVVLEMMDSTATANPLAELDLEKEDTDAVVLEDVFARVRPLVYRAEDGNAPRAAVAWCRAAGFAAYIGIFVGMCNLYRLCQSPLGRQMQAEGAECPDRVATPARLVLSLVLWPALFALPALFAMVFYRVLVPGGPLDKLGLGKKKVALSQQRMVMRWAAALIPLACVVGVFFSMFFVPLFFQAVWWIADPEGMLANQKDPISQQGTMEAFGYVMLIIVPASILVFGVGASSGILWYLSMKAAVALSEDDVSEVVRLATPQAVIDDAVWTRAVAQPAIKLATHTMAELSDGWGGGTAIGAIICWFQALGHSVELMTKIHDKIWETSPPEEVWELSLAKSVGGAFIFGCMPLLLAKDLAHVSSMCDSLLNRINTLRLEWTDTATAQIIHQVRPIKADACRGACCSSLTMSAPRVSLLAHLPTEDHAEWPEQQPGPGFCSMDQGNRQENVSRSHNSANVMSAWSQRARSISLNNPWRA